LRIIGATHFTIRPQQISNTLWQFAGTLPALRAAFFSRLIARMLVSFRWA
jgi:hypothetical protein